MLSVTSGGAFEISADASGWSNAGVVDAGAGGIFVVQIATSNSGTLESTGGSLQFKGAVTGTGTATISGGVVDFGAASSIAVSFANASGTLQLDASSANNGHGYSGSISGFGGPDQFDLTDIAFGTNTTLGYAANANNTGGTLTVSDGAHTANLALLGQYAASSFAAAGDGHGGTVITDPPAAASSQSTAAASSVTVSGTSQVQISGASNESVTFAPSATGELVLPDSAAFNGSITGFTGTSDGNPATSDKLDLVDINFSSENASYANNILTVTDGTHTAQIDFIGTYTLGNFFFFSDGNGGTLLTDPPVAGDQITPTEAAAGDGNATGTRSSSTAAFGATNDMIGPAFRFMRSASASVTPIH